MTKENQSEIRQKRISALREEIERKTGKTPEQLYEEREKRVRDTIELREPDRVPLWIIPDSGKVINLPRSAAYYKPAAWTEAMRNTTLYFEPDLGTVGYASSGLSWEALDVKNRLWPGGPLPPDYPYQFVEGEFLKEDEYDLFLSDPSDFVVRYYLPRVYGALAPLANLPRLRSLFGGFEGITTIFNSPEFKKLARALSRAGKELDNYRRATGDADEELALLGFPAFAHPGGVGGAPFDTVSSFLRGMKGSMIDMYRRPEKLLQLCDMLMEIRFAGAKPADPGKRGNPKRVGIPLWRGDKAFMSDQQFNKFYWPGLKKVMLKDIELGYVPMPFFESTFGDRLECLLELPKGKVVALVDHTDVLRAKEMLGGHTCIIGTTPASLKYAPLQEIEDYYKNLIKLCKKGGGFMLNISFPDHATGEPLREMVESVREYGRY